MIEKQTALEKYQLMNINHTKSIFYLGVVIIVFGLLVIILASILPFLLTGSSLSESITGLVGGILTNIVGGVFIQMYLKTQEISIKQQDDLQSTITLYMSNDFISQIEGPDHESLQRELIQRLLWNKKYKENKTIKT